MQMNPPPPAGVQLERSLVCDPVGNAWVVPAQCRDVISSHLEIDDFQSAGHSLRYG